MAPEAPATPGLATVPPDIAFITGPTLYYYQTHYSGDHRRIKALVYGLAVLECLQTCMVTADAFHWFVFGYANLAQLDDTFLNSWDVPLLDAIIALIVQAFYCWRIHVLQRGALVLPCAIIVVSLAQCGAGIAVAVQANQLGKLSLIGENEIPQAIWLSGSALADIMITASLAWILLRKRPRQTGVYRKLVNRVVALTVETNSLTAGVAIIALVLFLAVPQHTALVVPPTAIMGKLYTNCLVAVLNNRQRRNSSNGERATSVRLSDIPSVRLSDVPKDRWNASRSDSGAICVSVVRDVDVQWEDAKPVHDATQRPMPRRLEPLRPKSWKQSTPSVPANWGVQRPESIYDARDRLA
ncbi:hypothetical protein EV714DRAFT_213204 [Schizophyllum commune]